jgi:FkbM family methyltransferase
LTRSRRKLEEFLWITGLHTPVRGLYRATAGRKKAKHEDEMKAFYGALLPPHSLVFDIGANVGQFSSIFSSLGARVIALEPNVDCVRHIQVSYAATSIEAIQAVAGPRNGIATLNLSDARDDLSSLSSEWIAAMQGTNSNYQDLWRKCIAVPMLTLDTLIDHYGMPFFVKIDVEGYEESVLGGLTVQPPLISFEFNTAYLEATMRCLENSLFAAESVFNFAIGDPVAFEFHRWSGKTDLLKTLVGMKPATYGDVFVKRL